MSATGRRPVFSVVAWPFVALAMLVFVVGAILVLPYTLLFDRRCELAARIASRIAALGMWALRSTRGALRELGRAPTSRGVVIVVNHRSVVDIILALTLPGAPRLVAKAWPGRVPLLGTALRLAGHLSVDDADVASVRTVMETARKHLRHGSPVLFFPEGTRRREPGLGRFRGGAFALAIEAGVPVVPILLRQTGTLVAPGSLAVAPAEVTVEVLPEVPPGTDRRALTRHVRQAMLERLSASGGQPRSA